jgi:hypothetical protein
LSTTPPATPGKPSIPLSDEARAAYQDLYDKYEVEIEASNDPAIVQPLLDSQSSIDDILTKDNMYRLHADTALFSALQDQINTTSDELKVLKGKITAISSKISTAGTIISAIDKVLSFAPGL